MAKPGEWYRLLLGWRTALRRLLGALVLGTLFWQIYTQSDLAGWWTRLRAAWSVEGHYWWLIAALLLMPLNWFLEIAKWRQLLKHSWVVSWGATTRAVLAGISVSLTTPNRIGEYGGRALVAPADQAVNIVLTSLLGSICQWVAFVGCGWPALMYWVGQRSGWSGSTILLLALLIPTGLIGILLVVRLMWIRSGGIKWGKYQTWWRWLRYHLQRLRHLRYQQVLIALGLALVRFWVYSLQFLFLLWFFNFPLGFWQGLSGIFSIYLIQAGIPLPPGMGVITRSEVALFVWGSEGMDPLVIVSATFSVFMVNLLLPALLGTWFIVRNNKK